ncbi:hypothetical protein DMR_10230 [Solidesulfovibrio magneticus RS-1]|uniref:Uncharacterized protein n=1 Tax=Solidesulfovibrio magneticus (strain ATCC 700980 / DSM 13731 / RS-1) TaxID=573370 RepID=C4XKX6_SOLM1|nr:hypothetical protein DMR_10230 [Solidesulfovibrio magneticus RS-1]
MNRTSLGVQDQDQGQVRQECRRDQKDSQPSDLPPKLKSETTREAHCPMGQGLKLRVSSVWGPGHGGGGVVRTAATGNGHWAEAGISWVSGPWGDKGGRPWEKPQEGGLGAIPEVSGEGVQPQIPPRGAGTICSAR